MRAHDIVSNLMSATLWQFRVLAVSAILLQSCATARLAQFRGFSQAGTAYVKASDSFLDEAGLAAIRGDTAILLRARPQLNAQERQKQILTNNKLVKERLLVLMQIRTHGRLLRDYFEVIGAMADNKAPESLSSAAKGTYDSLARLSPILKSATIGNSSVSDALPPVVAMVVSSLKAKTLERELEERSSLIERELALQEAALSLLSQQIAVDLSVELNVAESQQVNDPYVSASDLPKEWSAKRQDVLDAVVASKSAGAAAQAAKKLRESFAKLVANQLDNASLAALIEEINAILDLTEKIKGSRTVEES